MDAERLSRLNYSHYFAYIATKFYDLWISWSYQSNKFTKSVLLKIVIFIRFSICCFPETFSLTHGLLRTMLCNLQILEIFVTLFISSFIQFTMCILYVFIHFKYVNVCFMNQDMVWLGECLLHAWKQCVFCYKLMVLFSFI